MLGETLRRSVAFPPFLPALVFIEKSNIMNPALAARKTLHTTSRSRPTTMLVVTLAAFAFAVASARAAETVTIYRDEFGVPHVYADSVAGAAFGAGYAQAEDRLEAILRNYRRAAGTMSEAFGDEFVRHDYRQKMWQHERMARDKFDQLDPRVQRACRGYIAGVEKFMSEHPEQVPAWAQQLFGYEPVMLYRYIIWGWPEGQAAGDLRRGGIEPDPIAYRGSNEWLITPSRTQVGAVIACIDPHLSWYGEFSFLRRATLRRRR